jgi:hypothetical protein
MAGPVNLRIFTPIPFPPLVVGGAPVKVTKANGIWTVALDVQSLALGIPGVSDLLIVYNPTRQTYFKATLSSFVISGGRLQRAANSSPIIVASNDQIINFNINAPAACQLPAAVTRDGAPLTFKDAGGHATAHPLVFTTTGGETIDGIASGGVSLDVNFGQITFTPYTDGTNTGWAITT